jgi:hypothetical protein
LKKKAGILKKIATAPIWFMMILLPVMSLSINFLLEAFGRHSIIGVFTYICQHPVLFLYNSLIILFTLSICLIAKRRLTVLLFITTVWFTLGVTNFIVLAFRASPLSAIDFLIVKAAFGMITVYLTLIQIIFIIILAAAFIAMMVLLYIKCPKCRVSYKKSIACIAVIGLTVYGATALATKANALEFETSELADAYGNYGFAYCFTHSLVSQGVEKPDNYNSITLGELIDSLESETYAQCQNRSLLPGYPTFHQFHESDYHIFRHRTE